MIKEFWAKTCAFDAEWVPCARSVRRLLNLPPSTSDEEAFLTIWQHTNPDWEPSDDPSHRFAGHPFIKLALSQIVSIVGVVRTVEKDGHIHLVLRSQGINKHEEGAMIRSFLEGVARQGFQLWGYNSGNSDLPILIQRAMALGIQLPHFARRPDKPWEGGEFRRPNDYFDSRNSQAHIDLMEVTQSRFGRSSPKLTELAAASGIPVKVGIKRWPQQIDGENVAQLYLEGHTDLIVAYNEFDALTNHLLMLRVAYLGAFLDDRQYEQEIHAVREMIEREIESEKSHLSEYLDSWRELEEELRT